MAAPGTYQLLTTEPKMGEVFTTDLLVFIEAHRRPSETVQCQVGQVTWVRIFSYDEINDPDFQPVPEGIIAVSPKYIAGMVTRQ